MLAMICLPKGMNVPDIVKKRFVDQCSCKTKQILPCDFKRNLVRLFPWEYHYLIIRKRLYFFLQLALSFQI